MKALNWLITLVVILIGATANAALADTGRELPEFVETTYWLRDNGVTCSWLDRTLDGYCFYPTAISEDTVFFNYVFATDSDGSWAMVTAFVPITMTCADPRLSWWWQNFCQEKRCSLWEAVEVAAVSQDLPEVTSEIIDHMVRCGMVTGEEFDHMTPERIVAVMRAYTHLRLPVITD